MAREMARERDPERSLLDRRSYLRLAGAAAAAVAVAGASGSADAADHEKTAHETTGEETVTETTDDTITVPAGETRSFGVGRDETVENLHVDVTADGVSTDLEEADSSQ